jgi:hypothetical protein
MESAGFNLNVFTNVASRDPGDCLAQHAVRSFFETFGNASRLRIVTRIFIDPNPNPDLFEPWVSVMRKGLEGIPFELVRTRGMIDGFTRSLVLCEGDYAMQLEHDFVFVKSRISHSLDRIVDEMRERRINYLRFNKRSNRPAVYDLDMVPAGDRTFPLCRISGRSNNPHIIDLAYYREVVHPLLDGPNGSSIGLEGGLCRHVGGGYMYGPYGHRRTVGHLDGRHLRFGDGIRRRLYLLGEGRRTGN